MGLTISDKRKRNKFCGVGAGIIKLSLLLFFYLQMLGQVAVIAEDIHHNLPDNLEIIDPKSLGLSGTDLENFLGNVKLLPLGDTFQPGGGGPKAQILTVGFDGNEQLNLEDFAALSSDGLADTDKHVAEMAFKKFKDFFKNPGSAQNFDEAQRGNSGNTATSPVPQQSQHHHQQQQPQPTPTYASPFNDNNYNSNHNNNNNEAFLGSGVSSTAYPTHQSYVAETSSASNEGGQDGGRPKPKKKRVRVNKRPVLFSSTFKSNNLDDEEYINNHSTEPPTVSSENFQDYARVIQELQTKPPPTSFSNELRNHQYNNNSHNFNNQNHNFHNQQQAQVLKQNEHETQHHHNNQVANNAHPEPRPDIEPPKPTVLHQINFEQSKPTNPTHQPQPQQFEQPKPTKPVQYIEHNRNPIHQQFGPDIQVAFPTQYFVAPSAPSHQPPQAPQYFIQEQVQQQSTQSHQTQHQNPIPPTSTSVHVQHHYNPIHQQHNNNVNQADNSKYTSEPSARQNSNTNFLQQQTQYAPLLPAPTAQVSTLQTSFATPPVTTSHQQSIQYENQLTNQEYSGFQNQAEQRANNFVQPTPSVQTEHRQHAQYQQPQQNLNPAPPPKFDFSTHQHNRFRVISQQGTNNHSPQLQQNNYYNSQPANGQRVQDQTNFQKTNNAQLQHSQPPVPPTSTTPRSYSSQGIFQVTPSMGLIPMATIENAMNAYKSRLDRQKSLELFGKENYYNNNGAQSSFSNQSFPGNYQNPGPPSNAPQNNFSYKPQNPQFPPKPQLHFPPDPRHSPNPPHYKNNHQPLNSNHQPQPPHPPPQQQSQNYFPILQQQPQTVFPTLSHVPPPLPPQHPQQPFGRAPYSLKQESQEFKHHSPPPQNFVQQRPNFRVPAPPAPPQDFRQQHGPSPTGQQYNGNQNNFFQNTRQQSALGNLLAPIGQTFQALANRFMQNGPPPPPPPQSPPPPKLMLRQPPKLNFRGQPTPQQNHQSQNSQNPIPAASSGSSTINTGRPNNDRFQSNNNNNNNGGFKFQTSPSTYYPLQFQNQYAHLNFKQTPLPPTPPPLILRSPSQQYFNSEPPQQPFIPFPDQTTNSNTFKNQPSINPQSGQLKFPDSNAVIVNNKSNPKSAPNASSLETNGHEEAKIYTNSLGYRVQSITSAPLISSFTVKSRH